MQIETQSEQLFGQSCMEAFPQANAVVAQAQARAYYSYMDAFLLDWQGAMQKLRLKQGIQDTDLLFYDSKATWMPKGFSQ